MDIPQELKEEIEKLLPENEYHKIIEESQSISRKYRENDGKGKKMVTKESETIAYAISRMPSTYSAVHFALKQTLKNHEENIKTVIDIGAGTGAATWALTDLIETEQITCMEREEKMREIGSRLMKNYLPNVKWKSFDLITDELVETADMLITSYVINELNEVDRKSAIQKMWNATKRILVIIEPGTPEGFKHILEARKILLEQGANILSPCTHNLDCPLKQDDWCSFYTRVSRSKMQRHAKKGELGYEDEKFSFIAFSKTSVNKSKAVILRHPQIASGYVKVKLCTQDGISEKTYSKKDGEIYKKIKKMHAGETI